MKKIYIKTYGCQMNVYDSERMYELMKPHGYRISENYEDSDLIILNTCHIREKAAEKIYSELGRIVPFKEDSNKQNIEKDLESLLKKIKKNSKYFFSIKDMILLESLKADGVQIPKKYKNIYEPVDANIPHDIQILINQEETGLFLLRLVEIIGEDKITDMDPETLYFIISALNQLDIDQLRNQILLKVLPLKV